MPKSSPVKTSSKAASSAKSSPTDGAKKQTGYQKYCKENRDRIKEEFPDLKGKDIIEKLSERWWDAEENPKRGQRPVKKVKKVKEVGEKENETTEKKKKKKKGVEASGEE